ncbi:hypothetical protein SISNIDRAFT_467630 [Sistotremastrum niveocremeum HHB9708]|uniref:Uncharacterized protein n=1 Tax=Sistotremastrum niveocremeum HHB9708 TaxID=1314777 RepID=A0A164SDL4_9AGAM|nr:hypothetical protein SISNIDRAFT_467630 [Sistotremastrum niveocremeum HHB9708]
MFSKAFSKLAILSLCVPTLSLAAIVDVQSYNGLPARVGTQYTLEFITGNTFIEVADYYVALGWTKGSSPPEGSIGSFVSGTIDLVPINKVHTGAGSFTSQVYIDPAKFDVDDTTAYTLTAAVFSVEGSTHEPKINILATRIDINPEIIKLPA